MNGLKITKASARRGKGFYGCQACSGPYVYRQSLAGGGMKLFSTHAPVDDRIRRLEQM